MTGLKSKILFFARKPFPGQFSLESSFSRTIADLTGLGVPVRQVTANSYSKGFLSRVRILLAVRRLREKPASIIHITGDITFAGIMAPRPFSLTVHDLEFVRRAKGWRKWLLRHLWLDWPCRRATKITVISEETKKNLIEFCPRLDPDKIVLIPNSVADEFQPASRTNAGGTINVLQVGTKPNKNVPRLIQALDTLDCKLTIIGEKTEEIEDALRLTSVEAEFRQNLTQAEVIAAYEECDILAFVSLEEGFGMPIVEAQRTGRPVLTANCSAMPEIAGAGAHLVDPTDILDIREGTRKLIQDHAYREELVQLGFVNAQKFDREEIARRYLAMFEAMESLS